MKNRGGYTILETMITLAISASLFIIVSITFSGRQGRIEFSQGIRDIDAHIRDISNDVRNGFYTASQNVCKKQPDGSIAFEAGSSVQGTNTDCVFAGKVMLFGPNSSTDGGIVSSYSLAGSRNAADMTSLKPTIIDGGDTLVAEKYNMPSLIKLVNSSGSSISVAVMILFDLDSSTVDGVANISPYKLKDVNVDNLSTKLSGAFISVPPTAEKIQNNPLTLCFKSGTSNQFGTIEIKRALDGLSTVVTILEGSVNSTYSCWDGVV